MHVCVCACLCLCVYVCVCRHTFYNFHFAQFASFIVYNLKRHITTQSVTQCFPIWTDKTN